MNNFSRSAEVPPTDLAASPDAAQAAAPEPDPRLITRFAASGGCAAKVGPGDLKEMMRELTEERLLDLTAAQGGPESRPGRHRGDGGPRGPGHPGHPGHFDRPASAVLVATETGDDAGVYLLAPAAESLGIGVIQTADFITPPFDDPEAYGQIAAANAISDVYAMGGRPISALNLCMFPSELPLAAARGILRGASAKLREAGAVLLGGHTVRSPELFFGLSVSGVVAPDRIWRNVGARPGDVLLITKPLGCGLVVTGARKGLVDDADRRFCMAGMARLNRRAAEVLAEHTAHAATDVTGFGLVGHGLGMTNLGDVTLVIAAAALPAYPGALALAAQGVTCGGAKNNRRAYQERIVVRGRLSAAYEELIFDPQTSGGLLCAVPADVAATTLSALQAAGVPASRIGEVVPRETAALVVYGDQGPAR